MMKRTRYQKQTIDSTQRSSRRRHVVLRNFSWSRNYYMLSEIAVSSNHRQVSNQYLWLPRSIENMTCVLVQSQVLPHAVLGTDILCQAPSGMGKTAVFIFASLQQLQPVDGQVRFYSTYVCFLKPHLLGFNNYPLSWQWASVSNKSRIPSVLQIPIRCENLDFHRWSTDNQRWTHLEKQLSTRCCWNAWPDFSFDTNGGTRSEQREAFHYRWMWSSTCSIRFVKESCKLIRILACISVDMRRSIQEIFDSTAKDKQVMMFAATLSQQVRPTCAEFMREVIQCCHSTHTSKPTNIRLYSRWRFLSMTRASWSIM